MIVLYQPPSDLRSLKVMAQLGLNEVCVSAKQAKQINKQTAAGARACEPRGVKRGGFATLPPPRCPSRRTHDVLIDRGGEGRVPEAALARRPRRRPRNSTPGLYDG